MIYDAVQSLAERSGLLIMGAYDPQDGETASLILLGMGAGCWPVFTAEQEYNDGLPNPLDRWSKRVIGDIAQTVVAHATFPSDGPPYAPFISWALNTGRFFQSPTGMMVHDTAGLMISIRGALAFGTKIPLPDRTSPNPCLTCTDQPCVTACPVGALSAHTAYDVPACKAYLHADEGVECMSQGCIVRRACPVSEAFGRDPAQSAFHMQAFKG